MVCTIEHLAIAANSYGLILGQTILQSHPTTWVSRSLLMMHVSEIDLRSVSISLGGQTFGMGQVVADFHIRGNQTSLMLVLNMQQGPTQIQRRPLGLACWLKRSSCYGF